VSRLGKAFEGGGKLVAFIVGGDPTVDESYKIACDVIESGADVLEVGLPFSDPMADGPTIQEAGTRALTAGMNTDKYFELCKRISKKHDAPLVCLTYYNLVLQYGLGKFSKRCAETGVDGLIVPDLPIEEAGPLRKELEENNVDFIFLVAETTTDERLEKILKTASGFVYIVALLGTTGAREEISDKLKSLVEKVRSKTKLPLAVGFGISKPEHVKEVLSYGADAAIVGSGIVRFVGEDRGGIPGYVKSLKNAARQKTD